MGKGGPKSEKFNKNISDSSDMDDDIDVFHKQRHVVPFNLDDDHVAHTHEDNEHHVFQIQDDTTDDEDDDDDDSENDTGLAAKIAKQQKSLKAKIDGAADETQDDNEDDQDKSVAWGRSKNMYYETSKGESSEDDEEEKEAVRLQKEKTKLLSNADHGLDDDSEGEPTLEESLSKGKSRSKAVVGHDAKDESETEVVMKDPSALSKEEQMDIVYTSAPELVGLFAELNDAVEQLDTKVDRVLSKLKEEKNVNKSGIQYMELKKQLLLSYCQAITFHLLLKSEGHSVHDHPVLGRIVEIKSLLDKMKPVDENLSFEVEDFLKKHATTSTTVDSPMEIEAIDSNPVISNSETPKTQKELVKIDSAKDIGNGGKRKRQNEQLGLQSVEMLKVRAALEEKLEQKGVYNSKATKTDIVKKNLKPINGKLAAHDDFDDDVFDNDQHKSNAKPSSKLSQLVTQLKKPRVISGDDDLPKRDIGERRRKHEMRVLASAGIQSDDDLQDDEPETLEDDEVNDTNEDGETDSESDLYQETKLKRDAKLAAKAHKYSRTAPSALAAPETKLDGKRHINYEMEKNRGLTRKRNKEIKNPRKKYKLKHKKKEVARKGQVREHRLPNGTYGGEGHGINTNTSRSIRF